MTKATIARNRLADAALAEFVAARPSDDAVGAVVAAAALLAERAAQEISDRDRVIRIAKREGATLRALAEATGLSRQTIADICRRRLLDQEAGASTLTPRRSRPVEVDEVPYLLGLQRLRQGERLAAPVEQGVVGRPVTGLEHDRTAQRTTVETTPSR